MHRLLTLLLVLPLTLFGCDSTGGECDGDADCLPPLEVAIGNQGNFAAGDGSVTVYGGGTAAEPITDLGSIVQSVAFAGPSRWLFVTANTGGRVEVYDQSGTERVGVLPVENPRYVAWGGEDRLFVTSQLYDRPSEVIVADARTLAVLDTVEVGGLAEGVAVSDGRVYVATGAFGATQEVVVLDATTGEVVDRIDTGCVGPRYVLAVGAEVWVTCTGSDDADGEVLRLSAETGAVTARIRVEGQIRTAGPGQDAADDPVTDRLYVVRDQNAIVVIGVEAAEVVDEIAVGGDPIGAVGVDRFRDRLYLGRVPGFDVRGYVTVHTLDGAEVDRFEAGVAPTAIAFAE